MSSETQGLVVAVLEDLTEEAMRLKAVNAELIEALGGALDHLEWLRTYFPEAHGGLVRGQRIRESRAAIKKAKVAS